MFGSATGAVTLEANGKSYRLWLGMSVLADLQSQFGPDFDTFVSGVDAGSANLPNLAMMHALFMGALQRYHADEADRYLVDEIVAQNVDALGKLMNGLNARIEGWIIAVKAQGGGLNLGQMCSDYIAAGLPPDRFWDLTPRLYMIEMQGAANRLDREHKDRLAGAWLAATLSRSKRIPALEKLTAPAAKRLKPQTPIEKQAMFDALAAYWGARPQ
ncbi:MAG: hypothetical protein U5N55_11605 [Cypionkella sp.]|nr:hypothetical protein [Cypionkella sp.]